MDEVVARKLSRQLRVLNVLLVFFTLIFVAGFVVVGIAAYEAVHEVRQAENKLTSLQSQTQQTLDLKSKLCSTSSSLSGLLRQQSDVCN